MQTHELKILPIFYIHIKYGEKKFEIRRNDRNFKEGDKVILRCHENGEYLNLDPLPIKITYITSYEQKENYIVFGFEKLFRKD